MELEYVLHPQPYSGQLEVKVFCSDFELPEDLVSRLISRMMPGVMELEYVLPPQPYSGQLEVKVFCSDFELPEDLSQLISEISQDAVAQGAFGDVWKCRLSCGDRNIKVCVRRA